MNIVQNIEAKAWAWQKIWKQKFEQQKIYTLKLDLSRKQCTNCIKSVPKEFNYWIYIHYFWNESTDGLVKTYFVSALFSERIYNNKNYNFCYSFCERVLVYNYMLYTYKKRVINILVVFPSVLYFYENHQGSQFI